MSTSPFGTTRLLLLGTPTVDHGERTVALPLNTPTSLLYYLAANGDWVSRSELAYLYRPDESESDALAYLRLQVHRAQAQPWTQGWAQPLEVEPQRLRWQVPTDLTELRDAAAAKRWADVIHLYTGPLLAGAELSDRPTYNAWLELEREGLQQLFASALRQQAARLESTHDYEQAAALYQRLAALDEFDEAAVANLVRALALAGDSDLALKRYTTFRQHLLDELGAEPTPELDELVAGIRSGDLRPDAPTRPRREPSPQPTTRFVGRRAELSELRALALDPDCRLLSIVGMGGSGKTRVALELERTLAGHFADGAQYVSLEAATSSSEALTRIAKALAVEVGAQDDVERAVIDHLSDSELVLLLDNLEHLPALAQFVAAALAAVPGLTIVASSRSRLQIQGEWLYDLKGLSVPSDGEPVTEDGSAAVELFMSAARRVSPRLVFDAEELEHVASICRQVDGLPLALELAAAWVRALPVARIASDVVERLDLLSSDSLDVPEKHRSVTALLDRTWQAMSEPKSSALMRLSVFRGGMSLEAAETVTGTSLPVLLSLVNQSLVNRDAAGRLSSHPLVSQYAHRRLAAVPDELSAALDRHAAYYTSLLAVHDPQRGTGSWSDLEPDIANVEQAWFRLLTTNSYESLVTVAESLQSFYSTRGMYQRGSTVAAQTVAALDESGSAAGQGGLLKIVQLLALSNMAREAGLLQESLTHADDAKALAAGLDLPVHHAKALRFGGDAIQMLGGFAEAEERYLAAIEVLEEQDDVAELANTLNSLASLDATRENFPRAIAGFERCVDLFEQTGDELARAIALNNLGYIADSQGETGAASTYYEASLVSFERIQFTRGISAVKNNLVVLYGMLGRLAEAETMGLESLAMKEESNDRLGTIITLKNLGDLRLIRKQHQGALEYLVPALRTAIAIDAVPRLLQVLPSYAEALLGIGRNDQAARVLEAALRHPLTPPSVRDKAARLSPTLAATVGPSDDAPLTALLHDLPFAD